MYGTIALIVKLNKIGGISRLSLFITSCRGPGWPAGGSGRPPSLRALYGYNLDKIPLKLHCFYYVLSLSLSVCCSFFYGVIILLANSECVRTSTWKCRFRYWNFFFAPLKYNLIYATEIYTLELSYKSEIWTEFVLIYII